MFSLYSIMICLRGQLHVKNVFVCYISSRCCNTFRSLLYYKEHSLHNLPYMHSMILEGCNRTIKYPDTLQMHFKMLYKNRATIEILELCDWYTCELFNSIKWNTYKLMYKLKWNSVCVFAFVTQSVARPCSSQRQTFASNKHFI